MFDLFSFYRSREWASLLAQIKQERVDANGNIICEYCGKPIVRAYDCIGHHKKELTEENVNDYSISLNPENVALVHHRCHNFIHDKLGYSSREVFLVYGAPLAGKTSWVAANKGDGDLIIDMDNIWESITGGPRFYKPPRLRAIAFKIRDAELEAVRFRFGKWANAYIIGGYPLQAERERLAKELGAREIFIDTSEEECLARLEQDAERNKEEWRSYIEQWFARYTRPGSV